MMSILQARRRQARFLSYNFVKEGIEETLKEVPAEKVGQLSITYTVIGEVTADGNSPTETLRSLWMRLTRHGQALWRKYSRQPPAKKMTDQLHGCKDSRSRSNL